MLEYRDVRVLTNHTRRRARSSARSAAGVLGALAALTRGNWVGPKTEVELPAASSTAISTPCGPLASVLASTLTIAPETLAGTAPAAGTGWGRRRRGWPPCSSRRPAAAWRAAFRRRSPPPGRRRRRGRRR